MSCFVNLPTILFTEARYWMKQKPTFAVKENWEWVNFILGMYYANFAPGNRITTKFNENLRIYLHRNKTN